MTHLSDLIPAYVTSDADVVAADIEWGKTAYGPSGKLIGTANSPPVFRDNLVSWWGLDEVSGVRYDLHGANDLTDRNTVLQAASGLIGDSAQFVEANAEYLDVAAGHGLHGGDRDWSFATWVYLDATATASFAGCGALSTSSAAAIDWLIYYSASRFRFVTCDAGFDIAVADNFGVASLSTWYLVYVQYETATNTMSISINDGTFDTLVASGARNNVGNLFTLGGSLSGGSISWDGRMDVSAFWNYLLPSGLQTEFYNSGSGITYASTA